MNIYQSQSIRTSLKNSFFKNFIALFSGNVSGQLVIVLSSPILSRLFSPESFGLFELILSIFTILSVVVNWKIDNAIVIQKGDREADEIFLICFFLNTCMFALSSLIFGFLTFSNIAFFTETLDQWWWIPCLLGWLSGLQQALQMLLLRKKKYTFISIAIFLQALGLISFQLSLGYFLKYDASSLIYAYLVNNIFVCSFFSYVLFKSKKKFHFSHFHSYFSKFRECKNFMLYTVPTSFLGAVSQRSLFIILGIFFAETDVGFAALAMRVMYFPITLITRSMGQVFFRMFSEQKDEEQFPHQVNQILRIKIIALTLVVPLAFNAPQLFEFCFGKGWGEAGYYAMLLSPPAFMLFLTAWLDRTHDVMSKQKKAFFLELSYDILLVLGMSFFSYYFKSPFYLVGFFSILTALYNIFWLALTVKIIGISYKTSFENFLLLLFCLAISTLLFLLIKLLNFHFILIILISYAIYFTIFLTLKRYFNVSHAR